MGLIIVHARAGRDGCALGAHRAVLAHAWPRMGREILDSSGLWTEQETVVILAPDHDGESILADLRAAYFQPPHTVGHPLNLRLIFCAIPKKLDLLKKQETRFQKYKNSIFGSNPGVFSTKMS